MLRKTSVACIRNRGLFLLWLLAPAEAPAQTGTLQAGAARKLLKKAVATTEES